MGEGYGQEGLGALGQEGLDMSHGGKRGSAYRSRGQRRRTAGWTQGLSKTFDSHRRRRLSTRTAGCRTQ